MLEGRHQLSTRSYLDRSALLLLVGDIGACDIRDSALVAIDACRVQVVQWDEGTIANQLLRLDGGTINCPAYI